MEENKVYNTVIIGSGPAGYTASIYCARALLEPLLITGELYGGQLMYTTDIENFPSHESISGKDLMQKLHIQAENLGTIFEVTNVSKIETSDYPYTIHTENGKVCQTKSIILSTGASALWLDAENEAHLRSNGVSTCATCDGAFFKGEELLVIGGGDSAMEEAMFLTKYATKVTIIHRRNEFRASKIMLERARKNEKIEWKTNSEVKKWILNEKKELIGALLKIKDGEDEKINCGGAFIAIGHKPNTDFLKEVVELDEEGYVKTFQNTMTSVEGIFGCGDVVDKRYKQAITASSQGCMAAMDCEKWLNEN